MQYNFMLDTDKDDSAGLRNVVASVKMASLESIMQSYLDQLPSKQALLIRNASVLGMQFHRDLLFEMVREDSGLAAEDLMPHAQGLLNSGWLRESESGDSWEVSLKPNEAAQPKR
jgi:hypothetical protein